MTQLYRFSGEKLDAALRETRIIPAELARRIGVLPGAISKWLYNEQQPKPGYHFALAKELKKPMEWFMVPLSESSPERRRASRPGRPRKEGESPPT